jgi:hypothetical protein
MRYDPANPPVPDAWLSLPELERIALIAAFHEKHGEFGESLRLHAAIHAAIENQIALGQPEQTRRAIVRLIAEGLDRHEALHAAGSVLAEFMFPLLKAHNAGPEFDNAGYHLALDELSVESWRGKV